MNQPSLACQVNQPQAHGNLYFRKLSILCIAASIWLCGPLRTCLARAATTLASSSAIDSRTCESATRALEWLLRVSGCRDNCVGASGGGPAIDPGRLGRGLPKIAASKVAAFAVR